MKGVSEQENQLEKKQEGLACQEIEITNQSEVQGKYS